MTMKEVKHAARVALTEELMKDWLKVFHVISSRRQTLRASRSFAQLSEHVFCGALTTINHEGSRALTDNGITHVINCTAVSLEAEPIPQGIQVVPVPDPNAKTFIASNFEFVKGTIEAVTAKNGRVMLACTSGINRATVLCAAYLIWKRKSTLLSTLLTMCDRIGPCFAVESYQRELIAFANDHGKLDPPSTWPSLTEEEHPILEQLMGGWERPTPELFCDDADYENPSDGEDDVGRVKSPQQIAEMRYREALKRYRQMQGMKTKIHIGSDCASDGGDTDLL